MSAMLCSHADGDDYALTMTSAVADNHAGARAHGRQASMPPGYGVRLAPALKHGRLRTTPVRPRAQGRRAGGELRAADSTLAGS